MELARTQDLPVLSVAPYNRPFEIGCLVRVVKKYHDGSTEIYEGPLNSWEVSHNDYSTTIVIGVGRAHIEVYSQMEYSMDYFDMYGDVATYRGPMSYADFNATIEHLDYSEPL